jgi:hypothetical protein
VQDATDQGASDALIQDLGQQVLTLNAALREAKRDCCTSEKQLKDALCALGFEEAKVAMLEGELAKLAMDTDALLARFEEEYTFHDDEFSDDEAEDSGAGENEEALAGCVASTSAHLPVATGVYDASASFASAAQVGGPQEGVEGMASRTGGDSGQSMTHPDDGCAGAVSMEMHVGTGTGNSLENWPDQGNSGLGSAPVGVPGAPSLEAVLGTVLGEVSVLASTQAAAPDDTFEGFSASGGEEVKPPLWPQVGSVPGGAEGVPGDSCAEPAADGGEAHLLERSGPSHTARPGARSEGAHAPAAMVSSNAASVGLSAGTSSGIAVVGMATMAAAGGWPQEEAPAGACGGAQPPEQSEQTVGGWLAPPAGAPPDPQSFWDDDDDDGNTWGSHAAVQPSSAPPAHASTSSWAAPQTAAANDSGWNANNDGWNAGWAQQSAEVDTQGWSLDPVQAPVTTKPPDHTSACPAQSEEWGSDWPEEAAASAPLAASSVEGPVHDAPWAGAVPPGAAPPEGMALQQEGDAQSEPFWAGTEHPADMAAGGTQENGNNFWESLCETEVPQSSELENGHSDPVEAAAGGPLGGQVGQGIWNGPPSAVVAAGREGNAWDEWGADDWGV